MLNHPTDQQIEAMLALSNNPSFEQILKWVEGSLHNLNDAIITDRDEVSLRMSQGSAQVMKRLLETCRSARTLKEKRTITAVKAGNLSRPF